MNLTGVARRCAGGMLIKGRHVLLGKRSAQRKFYPGVWDIPGGHCRATETPEHALVRELAEELGIEALAYTLATVLPDPAGNASDEYYVFLVTEWAGEPLCLGDEHSEIGWFTPAEAVALDLAHPGYRPLLEDHIE